MGQQETVTINTPIAFRSEFAIGEIQLEEVMIQRTNNQWNSFNMKLTMDHSTHERLEGADFFHNKPENRLDTVEEGLNPDLNVYWEIALDSTHFHLLPPSDSNLKSYFRNLSKDDPLLQENLWKALFIWTEIALDPSIGGVIKVGYKTKFSIPTNPIEALQRQGIVSKVIVTALIESKFPVSFDEISQSFKMNLKMENSMYRASIKPDNENIGLTVRLTHPTKVLPQNEVQAIELTQEINKEINLGEFSIEERQFKYTHRMLVPKELATFQWVSETLLAGVSLIHHYSPRFEALFTSTL